MTVNVAVGWGEVNGQALSAGALGENISFLSNLTYSQLRTAVAADASSATDNSVVASLPVSDPTAGGAFWTTQAQAKALGLAAGSGLDGYVGFRSAANTFDFDESDGIAAGRYDFFSVFVHEITGIMGRQLLTGATLGNIPNSYELLDLLHFSAAGTRLFTGALPGYFSIDNGVTNLANFNTSSAGDFGDWASSAGADSFLAFSGSGVINAVTATDMKVMDAVGWNLAVLPDLTVSAPTLSGSTLSFTISNTGAAGSAASSAGIYLSADSSITGADTFLTSVATPGLAPQGTDNESGSITIPTNLTPGLYYLGVLADKDGQVTEFNENNNVGLLPVYLGNSGSNVLTGNSSANLMLGFGGDDSLNGGSGADTMIGGAGNDSYVVDNSSDVVTELAGEGADTVSASATYTLGANIETLVLTGTAAINGTGNGDANLITGNSGANVLAGLGGADTLDGGAGADTLTGGLGADHFVYTDPTATGGVITDFNHAQADVIDLSGIDADTTAAGDHAFSFIATAAFHNIAGELRYAVAGSTLTLTGDTNGDGLPDFTLTLNSVTNLTGADLVL